VQVAWGVRLSLSNAGSEVGRQIQLVRKNWVLFAGEHTAVWATLSGRARDKILQKATTTAENFMKTTQRAGKG
jgi:hypothetical protein